MDGEHIPKRVIAAVAALNDALRDAKLAGFRCDIASVVEKDYGHTDAVQLRDITKSFLPKRSLPDATAAQSRWTDNAPKEQD